MQTPFHEPNSMETETALQMVTDLIAIPGKSGEEGRVVEFLRRQLAEAGIDESAVSTDEAARHSPVGGETGNLIVRLPGTRPGPRRLLMAHIDTVPLCAGAEPVRRGEFLVPRDPQTALGGDDRAGAAVLLTTLLEIQRRNLPHPPLTFLWAVQEEIGLYGSRHVDLSRLGEPEFCFNWDGREPNLAVVGATGDYNIAIEIEGIASHAGGHPEEGISAIGIAGLAVADLIENGWHGLIDQDGRSGTSNIGVIHGGDATNVVTPQVSIRAEARSHDPEFRRRIVEEIRQAFERAAARLTNEAGETGRVHFEADLKYEAFMLSQDAPVVRKALAAVEAVGLEPGTRVSNGGLDANWMTAHGFPTVTLGCGQHAIHTVKETLHVESFLQACRIALLLATERID